MEAEVIKKDGKALPVIIKGWVVKDGDGAPKAIGAFINDISVEKLLSQEKEVLRQQLQPAQKIEAIGTLAGATEQQSCRTTEARSYRRRRIEDG